MLQYILVGSFALILGFILGAILFKKDNSLNNTLKEFKFLIEKLEIQNESNTKEIKNAVKTASDLTKVLTTNQNLKGQFGQDCLEMVLNACFPTENIHYIKQFDTQNNLGEKIKPDYLINLPNNKTILIDCKLNLEKYIEYKENNDEELIKSKRNELIKDLNNTINNLSNKKYETANIQQPDFVLMYMPLEPIITLIYTDSNFISVIKNSIEKNVIIVGNSSILTVIRLTKLLWAQDKQEKNIENIINTAQNIYEYIAQHTQNLHTIKSHLEEQNMLFKKEYEKFTSENKLFKQIELLRDFGIQLQNKKIKKKLTEIKIHEDFLN